MQEYLQTVIANLSKSNKSHHTVVKGGRWSQLMIIFIYGGILLSSTCSGITSKQMFSYGLSFGDSMLGPSDTEFSEIHLDVPFVLFGQNHLSLHVSINSLSM